MNPFLADGWLFLKCNLKHYSRAVWGIGLKLDPDTPVVQRFFPSLIRDTVFEWRTYGLVALWGLVVSRVPLWISVPLLLWYLFRFLERCRHFVSPLAFWRQVAKESPRKFRGLCRYVEELILEAERADRWEPKPNLPGALKGLETREKIIAETFRMQKEIMRLGGEVKEPWTKKT